MMPTLKQELPKYVCHKVVGGAKIKNMSMKGERFARHWLIEFEEPEVQPITASDQWVQQFKVEVGGYVVQYEDGYVSFSPGPSFINGYTKLEKKLDE